MAETCGADCFLDRGAVRPLAHRTQLVWLYFQVEDQPAGTLEIRLLDPCPCGCGNLVATPGADIDEAPTNIGPLQLKLFRK